jgi:hypothetical protein
VDHHGRKSVAHYRAKIDRDALNHHFSARRADIAYLRILKLAAKGMESDVAIALEILLSTKTVWDDEAVAELVQPELPVLPGLKQQTVNLMEYDQLLNQVAYYEPA